MLDAAEPASATEWLKAACVQLGTPNPNFYHCGGSRIRQFYVDAAPQVARYLLAPGLDTPAAIAAQAGSGPSWYQFLTLAGALAVVNSVLMGGTAGLAVQVAAGAVAAWASAGVIAGAALVAHFARQRATWQAVASGQSA
jgi:hypothetical protein